MTMRVPPRYIETGAGDGTVFASYNTYLLFREWRKDEIRNKKTSAST
jgi:hypothetical protein